MTVYFFKSSQKLGEQQNIRAALPWGTYLWQNRCVEPWSYSGYGGEEERNFHFYL